MTAAQQIQRRTARRFKAAQRAIAMDTYTACAIVEGFSGGEHSSAEQIAAWQSLIDSGMAWRLQGWYGRTAAALIASGECSAPARGRQ